MVLGERTMKYPTMTFITALCGATLLLSGCGGSGGTDLVPQPFAWRELQSGSHLGELQVVEQTFRSDAELKAAYPNRSVTTDWSKNMIAFISLGEKPSTHESIKVLEVEKTATEVVIRYSIEQAQFGLHIFCQPGAYVEFSKTELPVRFEKQGLFPF